jgi:hypothetical protein
MEKIENEGEGQESQKKKKKKKGEVQGHAAPEAKGTMRFRVREGLVLSLRIPHQQRGRNGAGGVVCM